jgi:LuxR family glucitol operon transcriptional activator
LALEVAHKYLRETNRIAPRDRFGAIVWVSAKQSILTASGIISRKQAFRTLPDIYSSIAITIGYNDISKMDEDKQLETVRKVLTQQRTLLVVDNLETVDDETK